MNGRRAKALRRAVYGDLSTRGRTYRADRGDRRRKPDRPIRIVADPMRRAYQAAKRAWRGRG